MKKKILRTIFLVFLFLPLLAAAHFFVFPQETRCILIRFADLDKQQNIYFRKGTAVEKISRLQHLRSAAETRVKEFWNNECPLNYTIIYCNSEAEFNKYGVAGAPAATQLKLGAYVVLQERSLDPDIIAHEIAHTVLYNTIGWYRTKFKIPTWFDEGLAMQVDDRSYYSIDTLLEIRKGGLSLPDVTQMENHGRFFSGDIMLNFSTAKFTVHEWHRTHLLETFIEAINNGDSFKEAYNKDATK
ncbi:MAG: hypothetical protein ABIO04_06935 [Ferruginibacter sp.]